MTVWTIVSVLLMAAVAWAAWFVSRNFSASLSRDDLARYAHETLILPDGMEVNYRVLGNPSGRTILLVHGGGGSLGDWEPWYRYLEGDYRVIGVDLPGHGLTGPLPDEDYGPIRFAVFVRDFVEAMRLEDFVIAGHSFGGDTVVRYVVDNRGKASALILVASGGFMPDEDEVPENEKAMLRFAGSWFGKLALRYYGNREVMKRGAAAYFYDKSAMSEEFVDRIWALSRYAPTRGALYQLLVHSMASYEDVTGLDTIDVPTLILWGDKDHVALPRDARRFHAGIEGSELVLYEGVGHMIQEEHTEQSAKDLLGFLERRVRGR